MVWFLWLVLHLRLWEEFQFFYESNISIYLSNGLQPAPQCSVDFTNNPLNDQWASLPDHTGFLLPWPAYNASKPIIISHDPFRKVVFLHECVRVAVSESVRSGSVVVVGGIYYSDHWWLRAIRPAPDACSISTASPILLHSSLITVFRVVPTLVSHEYGSQ